MWQEKLNELEQEKKLYGEGINHGATDEKIKTFAKRIAVELNVILPEEYMQILETINGIEFNGFIFYGIDEKMLAEPPVQYINGLLECNKIWYENEWQKQYLFLGESNISWYVYDLSKKKYYELDNPSGNKSEEFSDIYCLLEKLLTDAFM
ncbi:MAG: SMI1/KNR4 family protein [Clostridium sp.]|nr:SMI1/KNR4 family protein [Clostridium sp.]